MIQGDGNYFLSREMLPLAAAVAAAAHDNHRLASSWIWRPSLSATFTTVSLAMFPLFLLQIAIRKSIMKCKINHTYRLVIVVSFFFFGYISGWLLCVIKYEMLRFSSLNVYLSVSSLLGFWWCLIERNQKKQEYKKRSVEIWKKRVKEEKRRKGNTSFTGRYPFPFFFFFYLVLPTTQMVHLEKTCHQTSHQ